MRLKFAAVHSELDCCAPQKLNPSQKQHGYSCFGEVVEIARYGAQVIKKLSIGALAIISGLANVVSGAENGDALPVKLLIKTPEKYDTQQVRVAGVLEIDELGHMYLFTNSPPVNFDKMEDYLDLVFVDPKMDTVTLDMDLKCVTVEGEFRRYSGKFVGIGWLTSKTGLLMAKIVKLCESNAMYDTQPLPCDESSKEGR